MGLTLIYFGVACTLLGANFNDQEFIEEHYYLPFHYAEFWSAFLFTLVEAFIFVSAGVFGFTTWFQRIFMVIVASNVVSSLVAALLFTFSPEFFERPAHYVEYASQITVTLANFIFIFPNRKSYKPLVFAFSFVLACVLLVCAILKLIFYVDLIATEVGPERASHFFEFTGEMVNSLWAFIYALTVFMSLSASQERHSLNLKDE